MDARKINISLFHKAVNKLNHLLSPSMILHIRKFMVQSPEHSKFRRFEMVIADTMESKHSQDQQNLKTSPPLFGLPGWLSWKRICLPMQETQEMWLGCLGQEASLEKGNDNPLQSSCLENSMDRGDWWAAIHMVAESQT